MYKILYQIGEIHKKNKSLSATPLDKTTLEREMIVKEKNQEYQKAIDQKK